MTTHIQRMAMQAYRTAWNLYRETYDESERNRLEKIMDNYQPYIAYNAEDPVWQAFIKTLPGYEEFWASARERLLANLREMKQ